MLEVEKLSRDCQRGEQSFARLQQPARVEGQHVAAPPFGRARVQALLAALALWSSRRLRLIPGGDAYSTGLVIFSLQPRGFQNKQLRPLLAQSLGVDPIQITAGRRSYDLRRLRLHGLIEGQAGTHRCHLAESGLRTALFYSRAYQHLLRPGLSLLQDPRLKEHSPLARSYRAFQRQLTDYFQLHFAA